MRASVLLVILRVAVLVALTTSASLLVDYWSTEVPYCSSMGCMGLRQWGYLAGGLVPVPLVGVVAFAIVLSTSLARTVPGLETLSYSLASTGGVIGAALIGFQVFVGRYCMPCLVTDSAAIVAGVIGVWFLFDGARRHQKLVAASAGEARLVDPLATWAWAVLGVGLLAAPLVWPLVKARPRVPDGVRERYVPGKINVVEFSDFECGHCRELHPRLAALVAEHEGRVNYVRMNAPLSAHPRARAAAQAAICAEQQGDEGAMTAELFRAPDLSDAELDRLALTVGLDAEAFALCRAEASVNERIDAELALLASTGLVVTPSVYVGGQLIRGAAPDSVFRDAFARAERGDDGRGVPAALYLGCFGFLGLVVIAAGARAARRRAAAEAPPPELQREL